MPSSLELVERAALVEQPQHHLLAPDRRRWWTTRMSSARPSIVHADLAVLRAAPLDDVHVGHDLDAADERRAHRAGQVEHVVQRAVDAEPDPHPVVLRLDVDVGGAVAQRLGDDLLDDLDDRRVVVGTSRSRRGRPPGAARRAPRTPAPASRRRQRPVADADRAQRCRTARRPRRHRPARSPRGRTAVSSLGRVGDRDARRASPSTAAGRRAGRARSPRRAGRGPPARASTSRRSTTSHPYCSASDAGRGPAR